MNRRLFPARLWRVAASWRVASCWVIVSIIAVLPPCRAQTLATITGEIWLPAGSQSAVVQVMLQPLNRAVLTANGLYRFDGLANGEYDVVALSPGLPAISIHVRVVGEPVTANVDFTFRSSRSSLEPVALPVGDLASDPFAFLPTTTQFSRFLEGLPVAAQPGYGLGSFPRILTGEREIADSSRIPASAKCRSPMTPQGYFRLQGGSASLLSADEDLRFCAGQWAFRVITAAKHAGDIPTPLGEVRNSEASAASEQVSAAWNPGSYTLTFLQGLSGERAAVPCASETADPRLAAAHSDLSIPCASQLSNPAQAERVELTARQAFSGLDFVTDRANQTKPGIEVQLVYRDTLFRQLTKDGNTQIDTKVYASTVLFRPAKRGIYTSVYVVQANHYQDEITDASSIRGIRRNLGSFATTHVWQAGKWAATADGEFDYNRYRADDYANHFDTGVAHGNFEWDLSDQTSLTLDYELRFRQPDFIELFVGGQVLGQLKSRVGNTHLDRQGSQTSKLTFQTASAKESTAAGYFKLSTTASFASYDGFIYAAPAGIDSSGMFFPSHFIQEDSRQYGIIGDLKLTAASWLKWTADIAVQRRDLLQSHMPAPRTPPLIGNLCATATFKEFTLKPALRLAEDQSRLYANETRTAGYAVVNIVGTWDVKAEGKQMITLSVLNIANRLYRDHTSFSKNLLPERGRVFQLKYEYSFGKT